MKNGWTPERRKQQAANIRKWQPWASSTGPKSAAGKAVVSRNAHKGQRELLNTLEGLFRAGLKKQENGLIHLQDIFNLP